MKNKLKKLWRKIRWGVLYQGKLTFKRWWSRRCPKIPTKKPDLGLCPYCGKPEIIHVYLISGADGWDLWVDCEDDCREKNDRGELLREPIYDWWPFLWEAWFSYDQAKKAGLICHR